MVREFDLVQLVLAAGILGAEGVQVRAGLHLVCPGGVGHIGEGVLGVEQVTLGGMGRSCEGTCGFFE